MDSRLFEHELHSDNQLRKDNKNIFNRLKSIEEDASFVNEILEMFPTLAVVANERCGSWYIDRSKQKASSAYFKSTDGHTGQWDFNLRRNNLGLVKTIATHKGCVIIDSTRRGKRIPDALSKTVPIWCAVINRAVAMYRLRTGLLTLDNWDTGFYSLPSIVSRSEDAQITSKLDMFAERLLSSGIDMQPLEGLLQKPLRPLWFTPQSRFVNAPDYGDATFWPVICLSASQAVESGCQPRPGYLYVQGSGDDQEAWCLGLTHSLFWKHREDLLDVNSAAECEDKVRALVKASKGCVEEEEDQKYDFIGNTGIAVGSRTSGKPPLCWKEFDVVINCTTMEYEDNKLKEHKNNYIQLPIPEGKKGQQALFDHIGIALAFARQPLLEKRRVLVHCAKGQDRSVGIALALLVEYFDHNGVFQPRTGRVDKQCIQQHLLSIISSRPKASPSRATLKKVNTYFMSSSTHD
ncbi:tRNA A64-2'-O-ribosylphosphate transferase [Phycomyces nitens]|nr:tRNA A64-2'-O-ribosylphosphate transferase [Phycomyces nitens]